MLRQREPRETDNRHLKFVRLQCCCICGKPGPSEAAHIRFANASIGKPETGMQTKPHDRFTTALCAYHHRTGILAQHKMSEREFWIMHGRNPFEIAERLWTESGGAARALLPKSAPRPKTSRPRKPPGLRRKIMPGRPLQSRGFQERTCTESIGK